MASAWDELQEYLLAEMRATFGPTVVDHAMNPRNVGRLSPADGYGCVTGTCGDTMEIWLLVKGEVIREATFWTDGCGTTLAAGSMVTELARGKTLREAQVINQAAVLLALGGLPEESQHCALLAANTLQAAIADYLGKLARPPER